MEEKETEKDFIARQNEEKLKLWQLFPDASNGLINKAAPIIERMSFLSVSMSDLEEKMRIDGLVETYQNGENQTGVKQSAAAQTYNNFLKSYVQLHTKLLMLAPYLPDKEETPKQCEKKEKFDPQKARLSTLKDLLHYHIIDQSDFENYVKEENLGYLIDNTTSAD